MPPLVVEDAVLALCGATYEGVGVAACVATSYEASSRVIRGLARHSTSGGSGASSTHAEAPMR